MRFALLRFAPVLATLLAPAALAQTAGQRLWAVDIENVLTTGGSYTTIGQPRVAPNGTVYVPADSLYALAPDGHVRWTAPVRASIVDVGPDGTVYTAAYNTVYAFNPDGTQRWAFTEDPAGFGIYRGPTVGPDGNVYVVTVNGGLGIFSLTPDGALRWNIPGPSVQGFFPVGRLAFGPDNLYYADENLPGCTGGLREGLISVSLAGEVEWCRVISGVFGNGAGARATLDGRAVVWQNALPNAFIQAYTPDGALDWTQTFLPADVEVGPDNNLYTFHNETTLVSLTADGAVRWAVPQPLATFTSRPAVAPDTSAVVSGSPYAFGENGRIIAADPADGHTLWSVPITGPSAGAAPAAFSPDGQVVYVPVNTLSFDEPDQLWAIQVRDARPTATEPAGAADAFTLSASPNPARGATAVTLVLAEPRRVTVDVLDALGRRVALLSSGALAAGSHRFALDASALAPGIYVVRAVAAGATATRRLAVVR